MRRSLLWILCVVLLLAGLALFWPAESGSRVVQAADSGQGVQPTNAPSLGSAAVSMSPLARAEARGPLDKASFDPFAGLQLPPSLAPTPSAAPAHKPFVGPIYVPPPSPPALNYRYLGQMVDPSGQRRVYLAGPTKEVLAAVGTRLDEGYVVEAINPDGVRLHYPPLDARAVIPLPSSGDGVALAPRVAQP